MLVENVEEDMNVGEESVSNSSKEEEEENVDAQVGINDNNDGTSEEPGPNGNDLDSIENIGRVVGGSVANNSTITTLSAALTPAQIQEILRIHMLGNDTFKKYQQDRINEINAFAQTKVFYVMQFITDENQISYGGEIQRNVCTYLKIDVNHERRVWEVGGKEAFRTAIGTKRKTTMYAIKMAILKCN